MRNRVLLIAATTILSCGWMARAQTNAHAYFERAAAALKEANFSEDRTPQENTKLVERNEAALTQARLGLAYDYFLPEKRTSEPTPDYANWRQLARLFKASGDAHAAQNDWRSAANNYVDAVKLGIEVTHDGPLMNLLVGQAVQTIGRRSLEENLAQLDGATAQHAARRLETLFALAPSFADTMRAEAALGATLAEKNLFDDNLSTELFTKKVTREYREEFMREYRQLLQRQVEDAARPYIVSHQKPAFEDVDAMKPSEPEEGDGSEKLPGPSLLARMNFKIVLPVYRVDRLAATAHRAQNQMLLAALALRAYHAENGKYPATLAELVPTYLEKIPTDPFGLNSPLIYQNAGQEYSLYSVGADGKDDSGRPVKNIGETGRQEYSARLAGAEAKGDIVFGVNN